MKKGKFAKRGHRGAANKTLALILSMVLIIGCVAGGTLAWLLDTSDDVENTFTPSTINVDLTETTGDEYKMVPGWTLEKDPVVTVLKDSEDSWVFLKVEEKGGVVTYKPAGSDIEVATKWEDFLSYEIDPNNWTKLKDGVYYCKATNITADRAIKVLLNNQVKVNDEVTKEMMDALTKDTYPTLTFKAYAVQLYKDNNTEFDPAEAWAKIAG